MKVFCGINFCDWQNLKSFAELFLRFLPKTQKLMPQKLIPHKLMPQKIITLGYTKECAQIRRKLNQLTNNANKTETRHLFYKNQKDYRKLLKYNRRKHEEKMVDRLESLYSKDRNEFWKYLKSLKSNKHNDNLPNLDRLVTHFKKLYFDNNTENNLNFLV